MTKKGSGFRKGKAVLLLAGLLGAAWTVGGEPVIRSGAEPDYPPLCFVDGNGAAAGFSVELLQAALEAMGREVVFETAPWAELKQKLADGELDALPLVGRTPEREGLYDFTVPYLTLHGALFVRQDEQRIQSLADLSGKTVAVMKGDNAEEYVLRNNFCDQVVSTATFEDAFRMLSTGEADAVIAQKLMGVTLLKKTGIPNVRVAGGPNEEFKQDFCFAVQKGNQALLSVLNEGLALTVQSGVKQRLTHQWLGTSFYEAALARPLVYGGDHAFPPYEYLDEQGRPAGFNIELARALARDLGINISFHLEPWDEIRRKMDAGAIDLAAMFYSEGRDRTADFSTPLTSSAQAIFARNDSPVYRGPDSLRGRRISVQNGDLAHDYLLENGFSGELVVVQTPQDALKLLADGEVDFSLSALLQGRYWIEKNNWRNLRAVENSLFVTDYCFAVPEGQTALLSRINEGLALLKENGKYRLIYNQWMGAFDENLHREKLRRILLALGGVFALTAAVVLWFLHLLRRQVRKKTAELRIANRELHEAKTEALNRMQEAVQAKETLELTQFALDHAADPVFWIVKDSSFTYVNNAACRSLGYTREELLKLSVLDIDPGVTKEIWNKLWDEVQRKKTMRIETQHRTKDGRIFPVEIHSNNVSFNGKDYHFAFAHDITGHQQQQQTLEETNTRLEENNRDLQAARQAALNMMQDAVQAKEKLSESEENLRTTLHSIGDAVMSTDTGGRVVSMNPVAERLTGWGESEASGKPLQEVFKIINEQTRRTVENPADNVLKSGQIVGLANHTLLIAKDGREIPIADSGAPIRNSHGETTGVVLVFRDQTEERDARRALEESEAQYRYLFENMTAGFAVHEMIYDEAGKPEDYRFLQVNPAFEQLTGLSAGGIIGRTVTEVLPATEPHWIETYGTVAQTGEPVEFESYSKELGKYFSSRAFRPAPGQFAVIFYDITERMRLQNALEKRVVALTRPLADEAEIAFDTLFDLEEIQRIQDEFSNATGTAAHIVRPDGTPITEPSNVVDFCKLVKATEKGRVSCLKSDRVIGAYHPGGPVVHCCLSGGLWDASVNITVAGKHVASWLIGQVRNEAQTEDAMRSYARKIGADEDALITAFYNVPAMSEEHFRQVAQVLFTLANQLSTSAYQNMQQARFISEQKKTEDDLRRLSTAIEQSEETVVITDTDGIIQYVNPSFEKVTGYSREEVAGQTPRLLKSGRQDETFYSDLWKTITSGETWNGRFINKRKNGELYTDEASISPVRGKDGTITGYVAVRRDITAELQQEEDFRQAQKMESVGQLAGGIAHDFNNMLQAIQGFAEILLERLTGGTVEHNSAQEIIKAAKRAAGLTRKLLVFSRKQSVDKKEMDLNETVRESEALLCTLLGESIRIDLHLAGDLPKIYADHGQMAQIIMNLAVNARDAMPGGGRLTIATDQIRFSEKDAAGLPDVDPGMFVCLSVNDTGCGMNKAVQERLFEPFFTTKEVGKGTGLGLAVIYGIVKQNRGWVHVYSEENRGTCFKIYLPALADGPAETAGTEKTAEEGERILFVEDDSDTREMVVRILEPAGYIVSAAATAEEALALFEKPGEAFNLLFSDIILPEKNGMELADELRNRNPGLPVLLYSGYRDQRERWKQVDRKGYRFLQKPFTVSALLSAVYETLNTTEP
jgi:PAS domain S-box-containing protein